MKIQHESKTNDCYFLWSICLLLAAARLLEINHPAITTIIATMTTIVIITGNVKNDSGGNEPELL